MEHWTPIAETYHPLTCGSIDGTDDYPHDKAILRALSSSYKPNKQVEGDPLCTVFVGRLNPDTIEETLDQVFSEYGSIKRLRLVRDIISGFSKRYAFIEYKSGSAARKASAEGDKLRLDDRELLVVMECERELKGWIPRRFGGGFGGKKESGQLRFGGKDRPFRKPIVLNRTAQTSYGDQHSVRASGASEYIKQSRSDTSYYSKTGDRTPSDRKKHNYKDRYSRSDSSHSKSRHESPYYSGSTGRHGSEESRRYNNDRSRGYSRSPDRKSSKYRKHKRRSRSRSREHKKSRWN